MGRCPWCGRYDKNLAYRLHCAFCLQDPAAKGKSSGRGTRVQAKELSDSTRHQVFSQEGVAQPKQPRPEGEHFPDKGELPKVGALEGGPKQDAPSPGPGPAGNAELHPVRILGPGYRFNDRYVVEREIGQGGMGKVFLARDEKLGRRIAVKVIRSQDPKLLALTAQHDEYSRAFLEEAKVGAALDHPSIAKVFDYGIENGEPFIVFEFVEGETLKEFLRRREDLPLGEAQDIVAALAEALAYAHAHQVIHRDLKPANICITQEGRVKILDLGLAARFRDQTDWHYCGTPSYIAPEQAASKPCDGRTDQYALAVIAFELVTGRLPFTNQNVGVLLLQHLDDPPPSPQLLVPDLPDTVNAAILRGLAKKPAERYASCDEFAAAMACQVRRRSEAAVAQFIRLAALTTTEGKRFSCSDNKALYLALASDGLYVWHREEVTRWALAEVREVERNGVELTVSGHDGTTLQSFVFRKEGSCEALDEELRKLLANRPEQPEQVEPQESRSVVLLPRRVWFSHQALGTVSHQGKTKNSARAGAQIQAHLLGADAVAEVRVERLPTFFETGYRCSGVAVRAVSEAGRLELGAHWLEQRAAALSGWMLASIGSLWLLIIGGAGPASTSDQHREGVFLALAYFLAASLLPLVGVLLLRVLRWPELVRPMAAIVIAYLLGVPLANLLILPTDRWLLLPIFFVALPGLLLWGAWPREKWLLIPLMCLVAVPLVLAGVGWTAFLVARTRRYFAEHRRLLAAYQSPEVWSRSIGQNAAWLVAFAFALAMLALSIRVVRDNVAALTAPSKAEVDKAERNFKAGLNSLERQPDIAEQDFLQALRLFEDLQSRDPSNPAFSHMVARTHANLAAIALRGGQRPQAEDHGTQAIRMMEDLLRKRPTDPDSQPYRQMVVNLQRDLEQLRAAPGRRRPAPVGADIQGKGAKKNPAPPEADLQRTRAEVKRLADLALLHETKRRADRVRLEEATRFAELASQLEAEGRWEDAAKEHRKVVSLREELVRDASKDTGRRWDLAETRNRLGLALRRTVHKMEAEQELRLAAKAWAAMADDFPDRALYKFEQARTLANLVQLFRETKRLPDAAKVLCQVEALRRQAATEAPLVEYTVSLGHTQAALGLLELDLRARPGKALEWLDRALETLQPFLMDEQHGNWARKAAVDAYRGRANALAQDGKLSEAITAHDHILKICQPTERAWYRAWRAHHRVLLGDRAKAVAEADAADEKTENAEDIFLTVRVLALASARETDTALAKRYAERALVRLRQAIAKGLSNAKRLKDEDDLRAIRSLADFQALLNQLDNRPKR